MKLLFILLPVCALGGIFRDPHAKYGEMSAEAKAELQKEWGIDPELRKARLERIAKKAAQRHNESSEASADHTEFPTVKIDKHFENETSDIVEVNTHVGIAKYLFEGDMHLTEEQLDEIEGELDGNNGNRRQKRQAKRNAHKWTNNVVYYYYVKGFSEEQRITVSAALQYIQSRTCVSFVEDPTATNRIKVFRHNGCYSNVGMSGGEQSLSLGYGCESVGTAAHEFIHALGFAHTHTRSDRNTYVKVNFTNIPFLEQYNFDRLLSYENILYAPYEYGSVMHYRANSGAKYAGSLTITPNDTRYLFTMGSEHTSFYDIQMINKHYECGTNCPTDHLCVHGGYPNPRDCNKCVCPDGYDGDYCHQRPDDGCGNDYHASTEWQHRTLEVGEVDDDRTRNNFHICSDWIRAPSGKQIQVKIYSMYNPMCQYGCPFNGIEFKTENSSEIRSPVFCCDEFVDQVLTSALNPMPIIAFNRKGLSRFRFDYRYIDGPSEPQPASTTRVPVPSTTCADRFSDRCTQYIEYYGNCDRLPAAEEKCAKTCGYCTLLETTSEPSTTPVVTTTTQIPTTQSSSTETTVAPSTTTVTATPPAPTTQSGFCFNLLGDACVLYVQNLGSCAALYEEFARQTCARTCGYC